MIPSSISWPGLLWAVLAALSLPLPATADDWPQFRGQHRDGTSAETQLADAWPEGGPALAWSAQGLGRGFSSAAVADGRVYVSGLVGQEGVITALDTDGTRIWQAPYGLEWRKATPGARSTPTVDGDRVYVISGTGAVHCFNALTGERIWSRDVSKDYGGRRMEYGHSESPLIAGIHLVCTPGGVKGTLVALDKYTGRPMWVAQGLDEAAGYCSPQQVRQGDRDVIVTMLGSSVVGVDAATGELLWRDPYDGYHARPSREAHPDYANTPLHADGAILTTSGYGDGSALHALSADGASATRTWADPSLSVRLGGVVLHDGLVYGFHMKGHAQGSLRCIEWDTGRQVWEARWNGHMGSVILAEGLLSLHDEVTGEMALVRPSSDGFEPISTVRVGGADGEYYAHPSIADGLLYVRHGDQLYVYRIAG